MDNVKIVLSICAVGWVVVGVINIIEEKSLTLVIANFVVAIFMLLMALYYWRKEKKKK